MAGHLTLTDLVKIYNPRSGHRAVDGFTLDIAPGTFVTLLGPSGCGKTTVLRTIAGFESPSSGELLLDGADLTRISPDKRPISLVFQSYALFPHLTVAENVGYGLQAAGVKRAELHARVQDALDQMGLTGLGDRSPGQLSGGQQQRVALARAMVTRPQVMLFDEPLSNLDATLRERMRLRIRQLQRELGATAVYVTHDQSEAMAMSDLVVVMNAGRIEQVASPTELYRRPATRFVAGFVGRANLIDVDVACVDEDGARITAFGQGITAPAHPDLVDADAPAVLLIRPESLQVTPVEPDTPDAGDLATVTVSAFMGERIDYELDWQGQRLLASLANPEESDVHPEGTRVRLSTLGTRAWVLPA